MNPEKQIKIATFVVALAETIVVLNEIWKSVQQDVDKAISSLIELSSNLNRSKKDKAVINEVKHD